MAFLGEIGNIDVAPADYSALPAGTYAAVIADTAFKDAKSSSGKYLECKYQIIDGSHKGRIIFHRMNLVNSNQNTVDIANREFSATKRAVGKIAIKDSEELHNIPLLITLKYVPPKGEYGESNQITKWEPMGGATRTVATATTRPTPAPATAQVAPAGKTTPPWKQPKAAAPVEAVEELAETDIPF